MKNSRVHPFPTGMVALVIAAGVLLSPLAVAQASDYPHAADIAPKDILPDGPIDFSRTVVLFYSLTCPHCHAEMKFLEDAQDRYPNLEFVQMEIDQSNNEANREFYQLTMETLRSKTNGWPRTVIGNKVFIGYEPDDGPLQWIEPYQAYGGYQNRLEAALSELNAYAAGQAPAGTDAAGELSQRSWETSRRRALVLAAVLVAYGIVAVVMGRRRRGEPTQSGASDGASGPPDPSEPPVPGPTGAAPPPARGEPPSRDGAPARANGTAAAERSLARAGTSSEARAGSGTQHRSKAQHGAGAGASGRYWVGGGVLLALIGLFLVAEAAPAGALASSARNLPFPVMVTAIALLDGFNPCAFTVLFILLSLLTHARRRRQMLAVGGVFVLASAVVYVAFIVAMIAVGSFALSALGTTALRVIGVAVVVVGIFGLTEIFRRDSSAPRTTLSSEQKATLSRRAGRVVRRFVEAQSTGAHVTALAGTAVLAIVVNSVELGCTAILPAVYMSSLLGTYGATIGAPHLLWTAWYGLIYVIPMVVILLNFMFTFRSSRLSERQGRTLKLAGSAVMILLGGTLAIAPHLLVFA